MSGVKRKIEDKDPDYEDITQVQENKRSKVAEQNAREAAVQKIEAIIKDQFSLEMKNKEHEIEVIGQRLNEARRMMDKLRACIVANYYANAGQPKVPEASKSDPSVLNHPAIKRFLDSPSRSSSPLNQNSETPSQVQSETESLSQHGEAGERETDSGREDSTPRERRPGRNTGKDTFGVPSSLEQHVTYHTTGEEASRLYMKKTIVVGNVSKYIAPDKREENDQSTHKWMVYVRGSRKEPSIDHFVKKVWFFLHPSYKPNDLVEVSEPPFHLTRRGWGEFPVRVQIHFKDQRNKRIDIIHHLKLDRTYTGLQTLGAETVVDVELHRNSLGDDFIPSAPSSSSSSSSSSHLPFVGGSGSSSSTAAQGCRRPSSPSQHTHDDQPSSDRVPGVTVKSESVRSSCSERNSQSNRSEKITIGSHGNSAFQPITASCKIIPQGQVPSPAESPGKSFQPITMSCKIVSGSPISTPSHSPLPRTSSSTPVHMKSSPSVINNPYIIVDKPGQVINMAASTSAATGSPSAKQSSTAHGARSPAPKVHTSSFLSSGVKVLGIPLGSAVKQVSMSSGQILVAKSSPSVSKVVGQKQVVAQGVAKAIVSGGGSSASGITGQQVHAVTKAASGSGGSGKSGVMATLQLPANNLANLANLPPGTKLYLTTNSKNPSGKGKLLLIPQGAILRASHSTGQQSQSSGSGGSHSSSGSSGSGSLPSNLSYTSYILKQTPQGTFLVGQPGSSGKQSSGGHVASNPASSTQQAIRVTAGQKAAILAQVVGGSQGSQVKLSDGSVKMVTAAAASHLNKPGTTTLRMTGGVITATSSTPSTPSATPTSQQSAEATGGSSSQPFPQTAKVPPQHPVLVAANQAAVISAAKSASSAANTAKSSASGTGAVVTVAKSVNMPLISLSKGAGSSVVGGAKSSSPSLVTAASLIGGGTVSGKTAATISGMLKLHQAQSSSQQTVLTIPANQLKQLSVGSGSSGLQTILMPVGKVMQSGAKGASGSNTTTSGAASSASTPVAQVKTEPGLVSSSCTTPVPQTSAPASTAPTSGPLPTTPTSTDPAATIKVEQGIESTTHELINTEHIENMTQLLTAIVKKFPLIVPEKNEDSHPFCATSVDQYYSWNIGKRRAAELQRAVAVRRVCADLLERTPRLQALTPPRTKEVLRWCRLRGYTPPDPEPQRTEEDSIEDILTQIDSEPASVNVLSSSTLTGCEELSQRLEQLQRILKAEPDEEDDEPLDIISVKDIDAAKVKIKLEQDEAEQEPKFFLGRCPSTQFIRDTAEQIGVTLQQVEVEKNVFAPVVETMILKAVEQFTSEILRESLANAHGKSQQNRTPREISAMDVHQAISSIPTCDFLTNRYMGIMVKNEGHAD
ncbi:YEATS domain-containing 2 isoform X1 [Labeo rohita]|uniref:YEATS domain-containing protein 2 n=1 Tax=Labeo rohita TaxID=84645 RepID=A0A498MFW8_LABRO|nr:YEATS domain-containing 2 isoform X1 [Labeo rohita]